MLVYGFNNVRGGGFCIVDFEYDEPTVIKF